MQLASSFKAKPVASAAPSSTATSLAPVPPLQSTTTGSVCEATCLEVLQGEIGRNFDVDKVQGIGFEIGYRFLTRFASNAMGPSPLRRNDLEAFKFVCKEVWIELYGKKVDRLQTNHRGTFMCTDLAFAPVARLSSTSELDRFLALHKGMLCGALRNLGVHVTDIQAQVLGGGSGCCFTFKTLAQQ